MAALTNSEDPDKMLQNATLHQGLHCLLQHQACKLKLQTNTFLIYIVYMYGNIHQMVKDDQELRCLHSKTLKYYNGIFSFLAC